MFSMDDCYISITKDIQLITSIVTIPKLFELAIGDGTKREEWEPKPGSVWLKVKYKDKLLGVLNLEARGVLIEVHWYMQPKYHGNKLMDVAEYCLVQWLRENTNFLKIMVTCPSLCPHTIQSAISHEFIVEGYYKNSMIWHGQLCDTVVCTKEIKTLEEMNENFIKLTEKENG